MSEIKPVYQWQHSRGGVLNNTWWHDSNEADFKARDNKPQFNVRIMYETSAIIESLKRDNEALQIENAAQAKRIEELENATNIALQYADDIGDESIEFDQLRSVMTSASKNGE